MNESVDKKFVDHPAPSIGLMTLMIFVTMSFAVAIPFVFRLPPGEVPSWFVPTITTVLILFVAILCFSFWRLYTTYYTVAKKGITVKYGPSINTYRWEDF